MAVNVADWLCKIDRYIAMGTLIDEDLVIATALANGETEIDGMSKADFDNSVEELLAEGFLTSVFSASCIDEHDDCSEHVLELSMPRCLTAEERGIVWSHARAGRVQAYTTKESGVQYVDVYRSTDVAVDSADYEPVAEFLTLHNAIVLTSEVVGDVRFLGGEIERSRYLLL